MPKGYRHLTYGERCQIYALRKSGLSGAAIARQLGRDGHGAGNRRTTEPDRSLDAPSGAPWKATFRPRMLSEPALIKGGG